MIQPNPNDPIHRDRYGLRARDGMSTGTIIAIVFAAIIVVGGIMWSLGSHRTSTANSPSMTTTTGQGPTSAPTNTGRSPAKQNPPAPSP